MNAPIPDSWVENFDGKCDTCQQPKLISEVVPGAEIFDFNGWKCGYVCSECLKSPLLRTIKAYSIEIIRLEKELVDSTRIKESVERDAILRFIEQDAANELEAISHGLKRDWKTKIVERDRDMTPGERCILSRLERLKAVTKNAIDLLIQKKLYHCNEFSVRGTMQLGEFTITYDNSSTATDRPSPGSGPAT